MPTLDGTFSVVQTIIILPFIPIAVVVSDSSRDFFGASFFGGDTALPNDMMTPLPGEHDDFSRGFTVEVVVGVLGCVSWGGLCSGVGLAGRKSAWCTRRGCEHHGGDEQSVRGHEGQFKG